MLTIEDILKVPTAKLLSGEQNGCVKHVTIDSRLVKKRSLFIAVKGERFDGHDFLEQVIASGAAVVVISKKIPHARKGLSVIVVDDTIKALGLIARIHRDKFPVDVIAVTGSVGKTTTKDLIASVLSAKFKVLKNEKTLNNHFGVPLTLFKMTARTQKVVIELGTNHPGEIRWLTQVANPTIAVLTNVGASHLEGLKNVQGVFKEKFDLIKYMQPKQTVIYNADNPYLAKIAKRTMSHSKISYAINHPADVRADHISFSTNHRIDFRVKGQRFSIRSEALHNVSNAIAAICCGRMSGIEYNGINQKIDQAKFADGRMRTIRAKGLRVIDDTYNANPISVVSAMETLSRMPTRAKKFFVCADMLELGAQAKQWHQHVGKQCAQLNIDYVFGHGPLTKQMIDQIHLDQRQALKGKKSKANASINVLLQASHFKDLAQLHLKLKNLCKLGDIILVKGSRSMKMERTVEYLLNI